MSEKVRKHTLVYRIVYLSPRTIYTNADGDDLDEKIEEMRSDLGEEYTNCDCVDISSQLDCGLVELPKTDDIPF